MNLFERSLDIAAPEDPSHGDHSRTDEGGKTRIVFPKNDQRSIHLHPSTNVRTSLLENKKFFISSLRSFFKACTHSAMLFISLANLFFASQIAGAKSRAIQLLTISGSRMHASNCSYSS